MVVYHICLSCTLPGLLLSYPMTMFIVGLGDSIDSANIMIVVQLSWYDSVYHAIMIENHVFMLRMHINHKPHAYAFNWPCVFLDLDTWGKKLLRSLLWIGGELIKGDTHSHYSPKSLQNTWLFQLRQCRASVPCERVFSIAGHIITEKQACLLPQDVNMLVFLAENLDGL